MLLASVLPGCRLIRDQITAFGTRHESQLAKSSGNDAEELVSPVSDVNEAPDSDETQTEFVQLVAGTENDAEIKAPVATSPEASTEVDPATTDDPTPNSEEINVPAHVTLNQAIFASLNGHPVIGVELEQIHQSQADYLTTTLFPNPGLFTDAQLMPLTRPFTVTRQGGPPQQDAILTYPIDWFLFGKRTAAMSNANLNVRVSQAEFENMVRLRVVLTAQIFYTALESQALQTVAVQNVDNLRRLEVVTQHAVEDGGRPSIELSRVRLGLVAAEQRLRTAQAGSKTAIAKLRAVMGTSGLPPLLNAEGDLGADLRSVLVPVDEAYEFARSSRPDIQSMQWQISRAESNVDLQQRLARPTIAPSLGYTRQYQQKAIGFPDANSWSIGLNMNVPIFDRNQGNICKATAIQRQTQFQLAANLLDLRAETEQAVAELQAAEENARAVAGEQLSLAQKVQKSIEESYQAGGRPLTDVIDAQRNYRETYALYVTARAEYWRALYRYYGVIGKQVGIDE